MKVALAGDMILTEPIRDLPLRGLHLVREVLGHADVAIGHFESVIHQSSYVGTHPAAEGGWTWLRSPASVVDDVAWLGFDAVTLASNHSLDYSYGGQRATVDAFSAGGIATAGTGEDLAAASAAAYMSSGLAKVGLLSTTSTFSEWSRAGAARADMQGRPGVNPLVTSYCGSDAVLQQVLTAYHSMGHWITEVADGEWWTNPAGLHNTVTRFVRSEHERLTTCVDAADLERHRIAVREASSRCDVLIVQCHNHEWDPTGGLSSPPLFMREFARKMIDAGADVVLAQGSHSPLRGIETYGAGVIFYDPGDVFYMTGSVTTLPQDFYDRHRHGLTDVRHATPQQAQEATASERYRRPLAPSGGYNSGAVIGGVIPVCTFDEQSRLRQVTLHPFGMARPTEKVRGTPRPLEADERRRLFEHLGELSAEFDTTVEEVGEQGEVNLR